jgi:dihydroxyacetone kinase DhaKLM complex PTS-EIIA-like component DhaM
MDGPLAGLPGASTDAGEGIVVAPLVEGLLVGPASATRDREDRAAWYAELLGPPLVAASSLAALQEELAPGDVAVRVVLAAEPGPGDPAGLVTLREARNRLLDDDRLELTGVHVPLPPGVAVPDLLAELDFTVPAWVEVPPVAGWRDAVAALAADGAERLALRLPPEGGPTAGVAEMLREAVDRDLTLRITGGTTAPAVLAALCAVRAALNGAEPPEIAAILAERTTAPLAAALRRMSDADAAVARVFLDAVVVDDARGAVDDLVALGLVSAR